MQVQIAQKMNTTSTSHSQIQTHRMMEETSETTARGFTFEYPSESYRNLNSLYVRYFKRLFDIVATTLLLLLLLPLLLLIACIVLLTSSGSPVFVQPRVGKRGFHFNMLKFRSMYNDHHALDEEVRADELAQQGVHFKVEGDARVTRIGRLLRKYSLDELPQLLNVLTGEMSLVGPRPLMPFMVEPHPAENAIRSLVTPGLTGLWQVSARSESSTLTQMIAYDAEYIKHIGFKTDLWILARTVSAVLTAQGAK